MWHMMMDTVALRVNLYNHRKQNCTDSPVLCWLLRLEEVFIQEQHTNSLCPPSGGCNLLHNKYFCLILKYTAIYGEKLNDAYAHTHSYTRTHIHSHIHTHTHSHTHLHTQAYTYQYSYALLLQYTHRLTLVSPQLS